VECVIKGLSGTFKITFECTVNPPRFSQGRCFHWRIHNGNDLVTGYKTFPFLYISKLIFSADIIVKMVDVTAPVNPANINLWMSSNLH
jgi:hypothetical protein